MKDQTKTHKKNILLLCGGGGTEHEISLLTSSHIEKSLLAFPIYNVLKVEIGKPKSSDQTYRLISHSNQGQFLPVTVHLDKGKKLCSEKGDSWNIDFVIPWIHGPPGETGEIQSVLNFFALPYLGCHSEAAILTFNKVSTKLWLSALGIPNTPFEFLTRKDKYQKAIDFYSRYGSEGVFIKAASQGSSVGCYPVTSEENLKMAITDAFLYSDYVLMEKMIKGRELEVSVYEYNDEVMASLPGEIICPDKFYSYEEKYDAKSKTTTDIVAKNIPQKVAQEIQQMARDAFIGLNLRHLSRVDFFYTQNGEIFINEINTYPGATPISLFPKMMEENGHRFSDFLHQIISHLT